MKVLVCGGRDYNDWDNAHGFLLAKHRKLNFSHVIHGGARGADELAGRFAEMYLIQEVVCPANWKMLGKGAGPRRNAKMLGLCPDLVIAFPGGRGTANMVEQASAAGVEVVTAFEANAVL